MLNVQRAFLLFAVVVLTGSLMPSLAHAHGGHAHSTSAVSKGSHLERQANQQQCVAKFSIVRLAHAVAQRHPAPVTDGCAEHCCGGANGMSCCGAALPAQVCSLPFVEMETRLIVRDIPAPTGIPPDALPKPPKSFA
jgi:hypothetical protein